MNERHKQEIAKLAADIAKFVAGALDEKPRAIALKGAEDPKKLGHAKAIATYLLAQAAPQLTHAELGQCFGSVCKSMVCKRMQVANGIRQSGNKAEAKAIADGLKMFVLGNNQPTNDHA